MPMVISPEPFGDAVHITLREDTTAEDVKRSLEQAGIEGAAVKETIPGIEDVFLELMKRRYEGQRDL
jgi:hypothetical protein